MHQMGANDICDLNYRQQAYFYFLFFVEYMFRVALVEKPQSKNNEICLIFISLVQSWLWMDEVESN